MEKEEITEVRCGKVRSEERVGMKAKLTCLGVEPSPRR